MVVNVNLLFPLTSLLSTKSVGVGGCWLVYKQQDHAFNRAVDCVCSLSSSLYYVVNQIAQPVTQSQMNVGSLFLTSCPVAGLGLNSKFEPVSVQSEYTNRLCSDPHVLLCMKTSWTF